MIRRSLFHDFSYRSTITFDPSLLSPWYTHEAFVGALQTSDQVDVDIYALIDCHFESTKHDGKKATWESVVTREHSGRMFHEPAGTSAHDEIEVVARLWEMIVSVERKQLHDLLEAEERGKASDPSSVQRK
jgi:hypothetical protein